MRNRQDSIRIFSFLVFFCIIQQNNSSTLNLKMLRNIADRTRIGFFQYGMAKKDCVKASENTIFIACKIYIATLG